MVRQQEAAIIKRRIASMKKFIITTALAVVLAGGAYAQGHHGGGGGGGGGHGGGGGGGFAAAPAGGGGGGGFRGGGGGPGPSFSAQRGASGPSMGNHGPTGNLYNRAPNTNAYENTGANRSRFTERNHGELYNRYEGESRTGNREGNAHEHNNVGVGHNEAFRHGIVSGNFFEHGRHFGFRRFWHGEWVFLTGWDDCTAWAWVNVAPGAWAWSPIDVCIG
jgi:hypothetical protein